MSEEIKSTLYELTNDYKHILSLASDPEIDPQIIEDTLESIAGEIEAKADGYAKVIAELKIKSQEVRAKGNAIIEEGKRINSFADLIDANIDRMKSNLHASMEATGKTKFKTDLFSFSIRKNPPKVVVDNDEAVLPEYLKIKTEIDKKAIAESLKAGHKLDFAHLESGTSLVIK